MARAEAAKQMRPPRGAATGDKVFVRPPFVDAAQCIELLELPASQAHLCQLHCCVFDSLRHVLMHTHVLLWATTSRLLSLEKAASRFHGASC